MSNKNEIIAIISDNTNIQSEVMAEQTVEQIVEQNVEQTVEQKVEQNVEQKVEQNIEQNVEQTVEQTVEQNVEQIAQPTKENTINEETILLLIVKIGQTIGLKNISINNGQIDGEINVNISMPWVKSLVNKVMPLYEKLVADSNVKSNEMILEMVKVMDKNSISNDIKNLVNLQESKLDIEHISEITKLVTDLASLYGDLSKTNVTIKKALNQNNIMTLLTIVLYTIIFFIKKDNFSEKDVQWIDITINCLKFTSTLVGDKFNFSDLFKCCKCC